MPVEVVGSNPGDAAGLKLLRSVFMKGMAAAAIESLEAALMPRASRDRVRADIAAVIGEPLLERLLSGLTGARGAPRRRDARGRRATSTSSASSLVSPRPPRRGSNSFATAKPWPNQRIAKRYGHLQAAPMSKRVIERAEVVALLFTVNDIAITLGKIEKLLEKKETRAKKKLTKAEIAPSGTPGMNGCARMCSAHGSRPSARRQSSTHRARATSGPRRRPPRPAPAPPTRRRQKRQLLRTARPG